MASSRLAEYLANNTHIGIESATGLAASLKTVSVPKGAFLLRQGEVCRNSFFVEEGLLRYYSIDDKGKEHILQFAPESWIVSDRESVYFGNPSKYFIQALEDSRVISLDEAFVLDISRHDPAFTEANNRLLHNHIRHLQDRVNELLSFTAEARYLRFIELYPSLLLRVPQSMVASYLGIAPESLSRVRKEMAQRHHGS
ncbi:Crp/Fnr family transcriptional regulator [Chitinophaga caseinilytica]|uniref:Crp/Fnr family transcriptional regulator n=1 Tax=Chitinophaga caseinilytica TaxID=2267521 RepID=A0ABZ2YZ70_9BACT